MNKIVLIFFLIFLISGNLFAQVQISGQVKDKDGQPLPGVNIVVKGTTKGTLSDTDGKYKLNNVPKDSILVFSFVGMISEELKVGDQPEINVTMIDDITSLEDVVVVGYGTQKRVNMTGSVASITSEEIKDIPAGDLTYTLKGRLSGVTIDRATGKPGAVSTFQIRESSSFGPAAETPLFVIDGIIRDQDAFDVLDATEVESISILKDAAAAVYGVRAAGGVVLVKTKTGKKGKPQISYSGSYGVGKATSTPKMLSAYEHASMLNDIYNIMHGSYGQDINGKTFNEDELEAYKNTDYNWLNKMWKNAYQTRNSLNITGGNEKLRYFAGGAFYKEIGNIKYVTLDRYSVRTNVEGEVAKGLTANFGISYEQKNTKQPNYTSESSEGVLRDFYKQLLTAPRWVPMEVNDKPIYATDYINWNPYGLVQSNNYKKSTGYNTNFNAALEYKLPFIQGLTAKVQYSHTQNSQRGKEFSQNYDGYGLKYSGTSNHIFTEVFDNTKNSYPNTPKLYLSTDESKVYQLNATLSYAKKIGKHDINAILVYEQSEGTSSKFFTTQKNPSIDPAIDYPWSFNSSNVELGSNDAQTGNLGYIGRLNYIFNERYILEGTFREDASTKFAPGYRWGFFPSVSAGWIISYENFFKNIIPVVSFMKLRGSAGLLGNDNTMSFQWTQLYAANEKGAIFGNTVTDGISVRNSGIITPGITWQKTRSYNAGVDIKFFDNKLSFSTDYYYKYTYDIFDRRSNTHDQMPMTVGIGSSYPYENYGQMYAKGVEFELGYNGKLPQEIGYTLNAKFAWNKAQRLKVFQNDQEKGTWRDYTRNDLSNQAGFICTGMIRTQEDLNSILAENPGYTIGGLPPQLGMLNYKDLHGDSFYDEPDGKIDGNDMAIIAKVTSPPYIYSFNCGAAWKELKLDIMFTGEFGHKVFVQKDEQVIKEGNDYTEQAVTEKYNTLAFWNDHWTPENPNAKYPRPYRWGEQGQISTFWMRDGNTLRLSTATLSYNMPAKVSTKVGITQLRIYFTATNLWTIISPYDYKDPSVSRAFDYPMIKSYNLGLNITL